MLGQSTAKIQVNVLIRKPDEFFRSSNGDILLFESVF